MGIDISDSGIDYHLDKIAALSAYPYNNLVERQLDKIIRDNKGRQFNLTIKYIVDIHTEHIKDIYPGSLTEVHMNVNSELSTIKENQSLTNQNLLLL